MLVRLGGAFHVHQAMVHIPTSATILFTTLDVKLGQKCQCVDFPGQADLWAPV